jgi:hypothetical protein
MASGLVLCRIQRPDTWQLRPAMCKKVDKTLAKPEPSTHGATDGRTSTVLHALHKPANTMMTVGTRLGELLGSVAIMTPAKPVKLHGEQRPVFSSANAQGTGALHATCAREVA